MKRVLSLLLCLALLIVMLPSSNVQAATAEEVTRIKNQITSTAKQCLTKAGKTSFNGYCGMYVGWQLVVLGINKSYVAGNGNKQYDNYASKSTTTGGYAIKAYPGNSYTIATAFNQICASGDAYNILVGFETSPGTGGAEYGHAVFIHAILDGVVYYSESATVSTSSITVLTKTTANFATSYSKSGYKLDGVIKFGTDAPTTPVNTANITSGTTYTVKNYASGKYITVPTTYNGSSNDIGKGHVLLNDISNSTNQKITFITGTNGAWTLKPQTTSSRIIETYMADSSRSYAIAGDRISLFNSNSLSSKCGQFVVSWVKEGVCALLLNGDRTLCLSPLTQAAASTNSDLYLTKYAGADWQLWYIYNPTGGSVVGDHTHKYTEWQHYSDVHWQVCSCGAKSNTAPHTWNSGVVTTQPTGSTSGVRTYTCTTCGRVKTETIPALGYTITVASADEAMGTVSGGGKYSAGATATITATANDGYEFVKWNDGDTNASRTITINADKTYVASFKQKHIHSYGEWQSDETNHWKECSCGNKSELAAHAWNDGVITTQPTGEREGIKTYTCATCKRTKTESLGYIIAITVNIDGSTINSMFSNTSYTYTCLENDNCTGMDAITEALIQNGYTYAGSGSYLSSVTSPNGVALGLADEKYGPWSGWMFTVNDSTPMLDDTTQARLDQYILKKGDIINFYYVECPTETRHHVRSADDKTKCSMCGMEMPIVYGDINGDGKVTSTDAGMLILYLKGRINISEEQLTAADVNGDGRVTSSDAGTTILYCKGKISSFPAYKN